MDFQQCLKFPKKWVNKFQKTFLQQRGEFVSAFPMKWTAFLLWKRSATFSESHGLAQRPKVSVVSGTHEQLSEHPIMISGYAIGDDRSGSLKTWNEPKFRLR